ncbi:aquaporin-like protein [Cystobasidium minutum MCA 4210]|uniref:aquaporin-like protein n=1 Tax=Cystobasidium minutum MCA 4210 TaxID=1397322 RepID=UPI0034CDDD8E|eukprot:jgi/Rhomi1/55239/CE55238_8252
MAATSMAMALTFTIWIFFRVTGAAFNPNVSFALFILGKISFRRFVFYVIAQLVGAIAAAGLLLGILPGPLLVLTQRASSMSVVRALFWEMFLTAALVMTILMTLIEKHKGTILAPLAIGFALFSTQLAGIQYTGAAVNTARAFGPAVVTGDFIGSHWIYWLGPTMGAALAAGLYWIMVKVHYWNLTPGADAQAPHEAEHQEKYPSRGPGEHADGAYRNDGYQTAPAGHNAGNGTLNSAVPSTGVGHHGTTGAYNTTGAHNVGGTTGNTGTTTAGVMHPTGHNMV